jgi:dimethylhistidine N-methyltransferase
MYKNRVVTQLSTKTLQKSLGYRHFEINSRLCYFKPASSKSEKTFAKEISYSLNQKEKSISPKFFYDIKGSAIFDEICELPEYYLTRTETELLKKIGNDLIQFISKDIRLVELGSGSAVKTRLLLDILTSIQNKIEYFPIDISDILQESSQKLLEDYENLSITGIIDSYEGGLEFVEQYDDKPNFIAFLGSSFGNFTPEFGFVFLHKISSIMKKNDLFFIGLDLVKDKKVLEKAYDDPKGITANFNLNVLSRINDELSADFDLSQFVHHAIYNEKKQRIEMYLRSLEKQTVEIKKADLLLDIEKDELIHTEYSHKYSIPQIEDIMRRAGFRLEKIWQDTNKPYALFLASKH